MKRFIAVAVLAAIASASTGAIMSAQAVERPVPTAQSAGIYLGGWAAFLAITEHMVDGKMNDLNRSPNISVIPHSHFRTLDARYDDANGFTRWNFHAQIGDFSFHYWTDCRLHNRKIDCGGPGGGPLWHRRLEL